MKIFFVVFFIVASFSFIYSKDVEYQPYILAGIEKGDFTNAVSKTEKLLSENGFIIAGKYSPLQDPNRMVICTTHDLLKKSVAKIGYLTGFALVLRFGIYKNKENIEISYMNPLYWGNAFFRKKFPEVESNFNTLKFKITGIFKSLSEVKNIPYGSKDGGFTAKQLWKYHLMIFMPYFEDVVILAKNTKYDEVIKKIEKNFSERIGGVEKVYAISFPEEKLTLYGGALFGEDGEKRYWPPVEKNQHLYTHTTALPFEFLVMKDKVIMLHGKYRVPIAFPDAGMGTFMKIMKAPGKTHDYMKEIVTKD